MRVIQNTFLFSELEILLIWPGDVLDFYWVVSTVDCLISAVFSALYCLLYFVQILNWIRNHNNSTFQFKQGGSNSTKEMLLSALPWFVRIEANELVILMITESFLFGAQGLSQRGASPPPVILGWVVQTLGNGKRKVGREVAGLL